MVLEFGVVTDGWTVLIWSSTCTVGALSFLKLVAEQLVRVQQSLDVRERAARKAYLRRHADEVQYPGNVEDAA